MDEVLRGKGKLPSKWADSLDNAVSDQVEMDVSDDEARSAGGQWGQLQRCSGMCGERIRALEATLNRLAEMVEILVAARGLASPALRLAMEKHKGRMAQGWDKSMS